MSTVRYLSNILGSIKVGRDSDNIIDFTTNDQITFATNNVTRVVISNSGFNLGGSGATVSTILDEDNMSSDNAAALATQQSIKAYVDANAGGAVSAVANGSDNRIATFSSSTALNGEANLTFDGSTLTLAGDIAATGDTFTFQSANADDPAFIIMNTANDNQAARLRLMKARTNTALNNDRVAEVDFVGEDDGGNTTQYGKLMVQALEVDDGDERGKMRLQVAEYDATLTDGLVLSGSTTNGEVDVTIGAGTASNTTIAGDLTVTTDIILDDGGSLQEAGGTAAFTFDGSGHVTKIGQDSPANGECLTWATGLSPNRAVWGTHYGPYALSWVDDSNDVLLRTTGSTNGSSATADLKIVAGAGVTLTPSSANMTIAVRDASGSDKGLIKVASAAASVTTSAITTTANRSYAVQVDGDGVASVNVPWVDTTTDSTKLPLAGGTITGTTSLNSDIALRFGTSSTFIEGATSGSKLMLNGQTDMFMRINGSTVGQFDASNFVCTPKITADAGIDIDNFNIDGTTIALSSGDMTLDPAGDMIISMEDGSNIDFKNGGNVAGRFFAEAGTASTLFIYEDGGDSSNDYCSINVATHGATTLTTVDAAAAAAHFEIAADGNITLDAAGNVAIEATTTSVDGILDLTGTTDSSDASGDTGILRCEGGASIAKKLYAGSTITGSADVIAYSDKKLKENIKTLDGKKVLEMRGVSFDRVDTGKASSGVIAQEMEKVAPELVIDDGNYKGVAYGNLVGYLIEAIKDQQKQIDELKEICSGCSK